MRLINDAYHDQSHFYFSLLLRKLFSPCLQKCLIFMNIKGFLNAKIFYSSVLTILHVPVASKERLIILYSPNLSDIRLELQTLHPLCDTRIPFR